MNYKLIKNERDKLYLEINAMKMLDISKKNKSIELNEVVKEKKKQYQFYNNLMKAFK